MVTTFISTNGIQEMSAQAVTNVDLSPNREQLYEREDRCFNLLLLIFYGV